MAMKRPSSEDDFGEWLEYFMDQQGVTRAQVARAMDVHPTAVSKWTGGLTKPMLGTLDKLVRFLRIQDSDDQELFYRKAEQRRPPLIESESYSRLPRYTPPPFDQEQFIVGREPELEQFQTFLSVPSEQVLNVYGPGGIGKTVVSKLFHRYATQNGVPSAFIDGSRPDITPIHVLETLTAALHRYDQIAPFLTGIQQELQNYSFVQEVIQRGAGLEALYDALGSPRNPQGFEALLATFTGIPQQMHKTVGNRFSLEVYLRRIEHTLTQTFTEALGAHLERHKTAPVLFVIDTYETLEEKIDDWVCQNLMSALPSSVRLAVLGRNTLTRVNIDWTDWHHRLTTQPLAELPEAEAKAFLVHYGLTDPTELSRIYQVVRGYPLLLVLASQLARELGGWEKLGGLETGGTSEFIAQQLLERLMREERVQALREFLEKGVVAPWFNAEVIEQILQVSHQEADRIYTELHRYSFIEPHAYGKKFHDKIREVLLARLKIVRPVEYRAIATRLRNYFEQKADAMRDIDTLDSNLETP